MGVDVVVRVAWEEAWDWGRRRRRGERLVVAVMVMPVVVERIDKEQDLRVVRIRRIRIIMVVVEEEERMEMGVCLLCVRIVRRGIRRFGGGIRRGSLCVSVLCFLPFLSFVCLSFLLFRFVSVLFVLFVFRRGERKEGGKRICT